MVQRIANLAAVALNLVIGRSGVLGGVREVCRSARRAGATPPYPFQPGVTSWNSTTQDARAKW